MEKFIPYEKMSKKQRKAMDALSLSVGNDQANRPCVYALTLAREKKKAAKKAKKKRR